MEIAYINLASRPKRNERFPITVGALLVVLAAALAIAGALSPWWILAALLAAIVPTPVRITTEILEPIDVCAATAHIADPAERVEAAHHLVHGTLARAVKTMRHGAKRA